MQRDDFARLILGRVDGPDQAGLVPEDAWHGLKALGSFFLHEDLELPAGELAGIVVIQSRRAVGALAAVVQLLDFGQHRFPVERRALFGSGFLQRFFTAARARGPAHDAGVGQLGAERAPGEAGAALGL